MEPFSKCPKCGVLDVRRTRCACGYGDGPRDPALSEPEHASTDDYLSQIRKPPSDDKVGLKARLGGLAMLVIGLGLSYLCIYQPLEAANRHEDTVSVSLKGAVICPVIVTAGLVFLIGGKAAKDAFGTREHPSGLSYGFAIVMVAIGFGLYFWLKGELESKGYKF